MKKKKLKFTKLTDPGTVSITVYPDMTNAEAIKSVEHELSHLKRFAPTKDSHPLVLSLAMKKIQALDRVLQLAECYVRVEAGHILIK